MWAECAALLTATHASHLSENTARRDFHKYEHLKKTDSQTAGKIGRTPSRHSVGSLTIKHFPPTEFFTPLSCIFFPAEQCPFISTVSIVNFILPASFSQPPSFILIYTDLTSLTLLFTFQPVALLSRQSFTFLKYPFHQPSAM